jgi:aquaporin Z
MRPTEVTSGAKNHWPEYLIEAGGLGLFMISASGFATLLEHPASPLRHALPDSLVRRALMGVAMGLTAIALIYSPFGQRSGAHFNPAVTLTFFRLGKVAPRDLVGYVLAQFIGGALGIGIASLLLGAALAHASVHYVATLPGPNLATAFVAELVMTALLMTIVLVVSNTPRLARFTGLCAGACVALFITFEAPISGMSLNPARTFASALAARDWTALWLYFVAPPLGMLAAATIFTRLRNAPRVRCAKLQHPEHVRCIFCEYHAARRSFAPVDALTSSNPLPSPPASPRHEALRRP